MNTKNNARLAVTVAAAGLMIGGLAPFAMADPSAPPSTGSSPPRPPTPAESCAALRQAFDRSNQLPAPIVMRDPSPVRVPEAETPTGAVMLGIGALGGATTLGAGLIAIQRRNRRSRSNPT